MFPKKFFHRVLSTAIGCLMLFSLCSCGGDGGASKGTVFENSAALTVTEFDEPVSLVPGIIESYLEADPAESVYSYANSGSSKRLDKGEPVCIKYNFNNADGTKTLEEKVEVSLTEDFSEIEQVLYVTTWRSSVEFYNLQTGTTYYYRVTISLENGDVHKKSGSFETAESLRFISLDGACNVRDIGGWTTENGKTIKHGLLYRGSEIDGGKESGADFCLTDKGVEQLRALGIKTDFDLRSESVKVSEYSILGEDVSRTFYNAPQYQDFFSSGNKETVRKIFSDLSNPDAYPAYLHCTHGVDRAGSTILLLESLLGLSQEDLIRDYELSAFYYKHVDRTYASNGILKVIEKLNSYEGETLADKTAAFLLSVGVTEAEISSLRSIFLE